MTEVRAAIEGKAADLREAFDRSFAEPPAAASEEAAAELLDIRVGGDRYAVELSEVTAVFVDRRIIPLPSPTTALLGVTGLRGEVVPVYALGALLGYGASDERPRWLMLAGRGRVAFAFDALEGQLRVAREAIVAVQAEGPHGHVRASARIDGKPCPIVRIQSLVDDLEKRANANLP